METRDEIEFRRELARIFRNNELDRSASLFRYARGECQESSNRSARPNITA
jgi:hypothetical protein